MSKVYITTTTPYVNSDPHIGFALEIIQADVWARAQSLIGNDVIFNTGTDEHGAKIYEKANEQKKDPKTYVDEYSKKFKDLKSLLNLSYTNFIRTTDPNHYNAAQIFWKMCKDNGDIYKKIYKIKYCIGCELEKTESELLDGKCQLHPNRDIEIIQEENYFFRFSKYQKRLLDLYTKNPEFVLPKNRLEEVRNFVKSGLEDFSISRLKSKMPWGIPVPGDAEHIMYVWFDALINYISTLGWPQNNKNFNIYWPGIQVAGKDNLRQQAAMWQAMLMSAKLPLTRNIFIHGFISLNGKKISKSTGNIVDPTSLVNKYGIDAVRYYLLREIPTLNDGDFSIKRMDQLYVSDLANELGNLVSRLSALASKDNIRISIIKSNKYNKKYIKQIEIFDFIPVLEDIWKRIKDLNREINDKKPWNILNKEREPLLSNWLQELNYIALDLRPFIPDTASKIIFAINGKINKIGPLFPKNN